MYELNLYPEQGEKKRIARAVSARASVLCALVGIELILICTIGISNRMLSEEAGFIRHDIDLLGSSAGTNATIDTRLAVAQEIISIRSNRVEWATKLAAISRDLAPGLVLVNVTGQVTSGESSVLQIEGRIAGNVQEVEAVSRFVEGLRSERELTRDFPQVRLGTIAGDDVPRFQIRCTGVPRGTAS
jgi:hypothetical protein